MQGKIEKKKSTTVSIEGKEKETFKDRLLMLIGDRSVRQASNDWGLPYSTLNNYLTRNTMPTLNVVIDISQFEKVSIDWLAYGGKYKIENTETTMVPETNQLKDKWLMVLESIDNTDAEALIRAIHRKGIDGLLNKESQPAIEDTIDSLGIRSTLKQAIKEALKGDESLDQEILRRIENRKNSLEAGQQSLDQPELEHKKIG